MMSLKFNSQLAASPYLIKQQYVKSEAEATVPTLISITNIRDSQAELNKQVDLIDKAGRVCVIYSRIHPSRAASHLI